MVAWLPHQLSDEPHLRGDLEVHLRVSLLGKSHRVHDVVSLPWSPPSLRVGLEMSSTGVVEELDPCHRPEFLSSCNHSPFLRQAPGLKDSDSDSDSDPDSESSSDPDSDPELQLQSQSELASEHWTFPRTKISETHPTVYCELVRSPSPVSHPPSVGNTPADIERPTLARSPPWILLVLGKDAVALLFPFRALGRRARSTWQSANEIRLGCMQTLFAGGRLSIGW